MDDNISFCQTFSNNCKSNDIPKVNILLDLIEHPEDYPTLGINCFKIAIQSGNLELLQLLFDKFNIQLNDIKHLIRQIPNIATFQWVCRTFNYHCQDNDLVFSIIKRGQLDFLIVYFSNYKPDTVEEILQFALLEHQIEIVAWLNETFTIPVKNRSELFMKIIEKGYLRELIWTVNHSETISSLIIINALQEASLLGFVDIVEYIIMKYKIDFQDISLSNFYVFRVSSLSGMKMLAKRFHLQSADIGSALHDSLIRASEQGDIEKLNWLYTTFPINSQTIHEFVLDKVIQNNYVDVLKWLIARFTVHIGRSNAITCMAIDGQLEMMQWVFQTQNYSTDDARLALKFATTYQQTHLVRWLIETFSITSEKNIEMFQLAVESENIELLRLIIRGFSLSHYDIQSAFQRANSLNILRWLYDEFQLYTPVSWWDNIVKTVTNAYYLRPEDIVIAFQNGIKRNCLDTLKWINEHFQITILQIGIYFKFIGNISIAKWFVLIFSPDSRYIQEIFKTASENGNLELMKWCAKQIGRRYISYRMAFNNAVALERVDILKWVCENYKIDDIQEFIHYSMKYEKLTVLRFLLCNFKVSQRNIIEILPKTNISETTKKWIEKNESLLK